MVGDLSRAQGRAEKEVQSGDDEKLPNQFSFVCISMKTYFPRLIILKTQELQLRYDLASNKRLNTLQINCTEHKAVI